MNPISKTFSKFLFKLSENIMILYYKGKEVDYLVGHINLELRVFLGFIPWPVFFSDVL